jgi:hypothetical protein
MSRNKMRRPYELPTYLKEMQSVCGDRKAQVDEYEAGRAVGNLHHEISTIWSNTERNLGMLDLDSTADASNFLQDVEAAYAVSLSEYLDTHIARMEIIATGSTAEILAKDCGTSYLSKENLIVPAFDNKETPYDRENNEYYGDDQAQEEQARIREIAVMHRDFLMQFKADFDYVVSPSNATPSATAPHP